MMESVGNVENVDTSWEPLLAQRGCVIAGIFRRWRRFPSLGTFNVVRVEFFFVSSSFLRLLRFPGSVWSFRE